MCISTWFWSIFQSSSNYLVSRVCGSNDPPQKLSRWALRFFLCSWCWYKSSFFWDSFCTSTVHLSAALSLFAKKKYSVICGVFKVIFRRGISRTDVWRILRVAFLRDCVASVCLRRRVFSISERFRLSRSSLHWEISMFSWQILRKLFSFFFIQAETFKQFLQTTP